MKKAILFYFPYAGASSVSFKNIDAFFSEDVEVVCIEYAGHGKRIEEKFADSVIALANEAFAEILQRQDKAPIFLAGHCLGALVAYEVCHLMKNANIKELAGLIISGQGSPDDIISEHLQNMDEDKLLDYLVVHELMDSALLSQRFRGYVTELILKPIINDSVVYDFYVNNNNEALHIPVTILYGMDDARYPLVKLKRWEGFVEKAITFYPFSGGHYFIRKNEKNYFEKINDVINDAINEV